MKQEEEKEQIYAITQQQYKQGLITTTDLLDAQIQLTQVKVNALEALFNYNLAKRQFTRVLGIGLESTLGQS